jgi:ABC-type antimicrobial peptide transport system permease subunit
VRSIALAGGFVSPTYFATLGIPLLEGRFFTTDDTFGRDRVVVVSRSFAQQYWPGGSALGARLRLQPNGAWSTVVGVVADVKALGLASNSRTGQMQLYQARAQLRPGFGVVVVRAAGDPAALIPAIKARIWAIDPDLVLRDVATAHQLLARSTSQSRFNMALLVAFAGSGLALALVGVYGVTAIFVGQRQREMGIRMALGATRAEVVRFVAGQSMVVVAAGIAVGALGALWLSRYLKDLVFQIATTDAANYLVPAAAVAAVAALATLVPLRRAAAVDPARVLRGD